MDSTGHRSFCPLAVPRGSARLGAQHGPPTTTISVPLRSQSIANQTLPDTWRRENTAVYSAAARDDPESTQSSDPQRSNPKRDAASHVARPAAARLCCISGPAAGASTPPQAAPPAVQIAPATRPVAGSARIKVA
ncbi:hypothetical protein E2C01_048343 [Portunus trituberculatus]|uniref:Uncharacterized protein n=1 Tax=Portunus trituberculatus TaxID=210409 RepID=A0A5B7GAA6_PORTR|nr:hypothetical protein [Portunus trituberculatus]